MLKLDNYSNFILDDINLEIKDKNLVILGSNGSGKTTLAKVLSGVLSKKNIDTKLVNYIPTKLEIFDEYLSVFELLELSHLYSKKSIHEVLNILDISHLKNRSSKYLSSGESALVLIASALLHNAKYTIFDEPTSNLDPQKIKMIYNLLKNQNHLKYKIIITHNLDLAYKLGYEVIYIKDGKIDFQGNSQKFFNQENLENYFDGAVKKVDDRVMVIL
jgi:iron complex transport system ATP-binding protein